MVVPDVDVVAPSWNPASPPDELVVEGALNPNPEVVAPVVAAVAVLAGRLKLPKPEGFVAGVLDPSWKPVVAVVFGVPRRPVRSVLLPVAGVPVDAAVDTPPRLKPELVVLVVPPRFIPGWLVAPAKLKPVEAVVLAAGAALPNEKLPVDAGAAVADDVPVFPPKLNPVLPPEVWPKLNPPPVVVVAAAVWPLPNENPPPPPVPVLGAPGVPNVKPPPEEAGAPAVVPPPKENPPAVPVPPVFEVVVGVPKPPNIVESQLFLVESTVND